MIFSFSVSIIILLMSYLNQFRFILCMILIIIPISSNLHIPIYSKALILKNCLNACIEPLHTACCYCFASVVVVDVAIVVLVSIKNVSSR